MFAAATSRAASRSRAASISGLPPSKSISASTWSAGFLRRAEIVDPLRERVVGDHCRHRDHCFGTKTAERLRVSDAAVGEDPAGLDRADLRERQEGIPHPPVLR